MSTAFPLTEKDRIQVGKPLPFSIFGADGKLLYAAGQVVQTERLRDMLVTHGRYRGSLSLGEDESGAGGLARGKRDAAEPLPEEAPPPPPPPPLERMRRDYEAKSDSQRTTVSIARTEGEKANVVQLIGAHAQTVVVAAPLKPDGSLLPVQGGQTWVCRTFQMTSAFRFLAQTAKIAFEPFPHLFLKVPKEIERRTVRSAPRANVLLTGELHATDPMPCLVVDLSATGARVAVDYPLALERGSTVKLSMAIPMLSSKRDLALEAKIVNANGASDTRYPEVSFYGIRFNELAEPEALVLHAFVNGELICESNSLWQMLALGAPVRGGAS